MTLTLQEHRQLQAALSRSAMSDVRKMPPKRLKLMAMGSKMPELQRLSTGWCFYQTARTSYILSSNNYIEENVGRIFKPWQRCSITIPLQYFLKQTKTVVPKQLQLQTEKGAKWIFVYGIWTFFDYCNTARILTAWYPPFQFAVMNVCFGRRSQMPTSFRSDVWKFASLPSNG